MFTSKGQGPVYKSLVETQGPNRSVAATNSKILIGALYSSGKNIIFFLSFSLKNLNIMLANKTIAQWRSYFFSKSDTIFESRMKWALRKITLDELKELCRLFSSESDEYAFWLNSDNSAVERKRRS